MTCPGIQWHRRPGLRRRAARHRLLRRAGRRAERPGPLALVAAPL